MNEINSQNLINCNSCNIIYDISHFISLTNGRQTTTCLKCRYSSSQTRLSGILHKTYTEIKNSIDSCAICGDSNREHLEFDHINRNSKKGKVGNMKTTEEMILELKKCRILCKKCHRKITKNDGHFCPSNVVPRKEKNPYTDRNRNFIKEYKLNIGKCESNNCTDISGFDPENLSFYEFDHIDPMTKDYNISYMITHEFSIERILKELDLCQLLCGFCHQIKTKEDKLIKRRYYLSLDQPLPDKTNRIRDKTLSLEIVSEIRLLFNTTNITQKELAYKYNVKSNVITSTVDNIYYKDPSYTRTRYDKASKTILTLNQIKEIESILINCPNTSYVSLADKFKCSTYMISKTVSESETAISDINYLKNFKMQRDLKINQDYLENKLNITQLSAKYSLAETRLREILKDSITIASKAKKFTLEKRNKTIIEEFKSGQSKNNLAIKYNLSEAMIKTIIQTSIRERPNRPKSSKMIERNNAIFNDYNINHMTMVAIGKKYNLDGSHISRIIKEIKSTKQ